MGLYIVRICTCMALHIYGLWSLSKVLLLLWSGLETTPRYDLVEYFSGCGKVSQAFRESGRSVASYDIEYSQKSMNFLESGGYSLLIYLKNPVNLEHVVMAPFIPKL